MLTIARRLLFLIVCTGILNPSAYAGPVAVHRAATLPVLRPLSLLAGGRVATEPSQNADGFGGTDYTSQWPGSYFRAAFEGTTVFFRVVRGDEILRVIVDGQTAGSLVKPEAGAYEIDGLSNARHEISVLVATESQARPHTFGGFAIPRDEKALRPTRRKRQIEFIGDSHTVGYGNVSPTRTCTEAQVWADTDDTEGFGAITAAHYDADYQVNAISGRGVVRNYNGFQADTLPQTYPYVLFDKQHTYTDREWKPQVVVIALGTNDFTTPLNAGERWKTRDELHADYEATYLRFLEGLRARDPKAYLIVWATNMAAGEIESEALKVVQEMKRRGDRHIVFLPIDGLGFGGCNWHPTVVDDRVIADKLVHLIDADGVFEDGR